MGSQGSCQVRSGKRVKPKHHRPAVLRVKKQSIVCIKEQDGLACARALITAKARIEKPRDWEAIRKGRPIQTWLARSLHRKAGALEGECGDKELQQFQTALSDYQIVIIDADHNYTVKTFSVSKDQRLMLLKDQHQYDVVTTLTGFFGTCYVCNTCFKPYDK